MRKLIPWATAMMVVATAAVALPSASFADTATTTITSTIQAQLSLIASLEQQIQSLMQQIAALRQQQQATAASLVQSLSLGSSGDQVSVLQALLASDPGIYPQGLITGYYGPLTEDAVKRFQEANGIEQAGVVGPQTRGKLNQLLKEHPLEFENENSTSTATSTSNGENEGENGNGNGQSQGNQGEGHAYGRLCAIVPPGHLIAPGWLRKNDGKEPIVPECQTLPPGIEGQLNESSTPSSTVTLAISNVLASAGTSTATVSWTTNLAADSAVSYGASAAYGSSTSDSSLVTSHAETLTGLLPATLYHFMVASTNASGTATSSDMTFTTNALPDTTPPVISAITYSAASTTANVSWTTNEAATGEVYYGTANPLDLTVSSTATVSTTTLSTAHPFGLSGLTASTTYYFVVQSADASANVATSSQQSFTTTN